MSDKRKPLKKKNDRTKASTSATDLKPTGVETAPPLFPRPKKWHEERRL